MSLLLLIFDSSKQIIISPKTKEKTFTRQGLGSVVVYAIRGIRSCSAEGPGSNLTSITRFKIRLSSHRS